MLPSYADTISPSVPLETLPSASSHIHDMRHQAQVPLDQDVPGLQIPLGCPLQIMLLLLRCQRLREAAGGESQGVQHSSQCKPCCGQNDPSPPALILLPTASPHSPQNHAVCPVKGESVGSHPAKTHIGQTIVAIHSSGDMVYWSHQQKREISPWSKRRIPLNPSTVTPI